MTKKINFEENEVVELKVGGNIFSTLQTLVQKITNQTNQQKSKRFECKNDLFMNIKTTFIL